MSLQVWLPLNGNIENKGLNGGIVTSTVGTVSYTANGKIGKAFISGGTSQVTNGISLNTNFLDVFNDKVSVAAWVKPLGNHIHYNGTILSSGDWNKKRWAFGVSQDNSKVDTICGAYNTYVDCPVPVNEWTHLVSVYDNGTSKVYKNGEYVGERTGMAAFDSDATNTCVGRETYASGYFGFYGYINDVRIYDHALSPKEIKEISKALIIHYPLDDICTVNNAISDCSGFQNNGTTTNVTYSDDTPRYSKCTVFSGSSSYIKITDNAWMAQYAPEMTINFWAYSANWPGATSGRLFSCTETGGFNTEAGNSGYLRFPIYVATNAAQSSHAYQYDGQEIKISDLAAGWHMFTFVYNGSAHVTYIDGQLHHTYTATSYGIKFNTSARMYLACEANGSAPSSPYFNGMESDFRLYYTALSADDIAELYRTSATVDNCGCLFAREVVENE